MDNKDKYLSIVSILFPLFIDLYKCDNNIKETIEETEEELRYNCDFSIEKLGYKSIITTKIREEKRNLVEKFYDFFIEKSKDNNGYSSYSIETRCEKNTKNEIFCIEVDDYYEGIFTYECLLYWYDKDNGILKFIIIE